MSAESTNHDESVPNQDLAQGVPKMPTASSAQTRRNAARIAHEVNRCTGLVRLLQAPLSARPLPNRRVLIMTKSAKPQTNSSVNCIAINGISKISPATTAIQIIFLICMVFLF